MTTTDFDALVVWLTACLNEDEQAARAAFDERGEWRTESYADCLQWWVAGEFGGICSTGYVGNSDSRPIAEHMARHDPASVLADVAAKRAIIDEYERTYRGCRDHPKDLALAGAFLALHGAVRALAAAYSTRPGYREEWRP